MAISTVIVPIMTRLAPTLGLIDQPDARKVHVAPISRVGGFGIVLGALIPLLVWLPIDPLISSYLLGSLILFVFGVCDDRSELGHYVKFIGQFAAVFSVIIIGDLQIKHLPLMGDTVLPDPFNIAFTAFAMIGMINATNHSDGLDGLAGGETILSLIIIAFMAYLAGGSRIPIISIACIGGILGFLRYNTHPAIVFMGDSGSQFLGFTLAFVAILLTQQVDPALSPAVVLLLLGLPIIDIISVFYLRASSGKNWFRASRNHVHHRILDLGFTHQQTVIIIYAIQAAFVFSGFLIGYEFDWLILLIYFLAVCILFSGLTRAERRNWYASPDSNSSSLIHNSNTIIKLRLLIRRAALVLVSTIYPLYLVAASGLINDVTPDFSWIACLLAVTFVYGLISQTKYSGVIRRATIYSTALFCAYLIETEPPKLFTLFNFQAINLGFYIVLAMAIGITIKFNPAVQFKTNPSDYLALCVVAALALFQTTDYFGINASVIVIQFLIVIYVCELLTHVYTSRWNPLNVAALATLSILALRGFV